jgi:hypothetical protein
VGVDAAVTEIRSEEQDATPGSWLQWMDLES